MNLLEISSLHKPVTGKKYKRKETYLNVTLNKSKFV
jgi:hypothetical protein